jgi:hypothetical protein
MVSGSNLTLKNVQVTENEAVSWGGGVFAWESVVTIEGRVYPRSIQYSLPRLSSNAF